MPEDHIRFRCYRCNQLLGASNKRAGSVITCPRCRAELKIPQPDDQLVTAEASRAGQGLATEAKAQGRPGMEAGRPSGNALPAFVDDIAAAIPDDLASLRPEDIRVEAEFADLVVTTDERIGPAPSRAEESLRDRLTGDPGSLGSYLAQASGAALAPPEAPATSASMFQAQPVPIIPVPAEPVVPAPPAVVPARSAAVAVSLPRVEEPPVDAALGTVLPAIKIEQPSLLPPTRQLQPVSEVILQPATVLAWSLLVLIALPLAFLAGLLMGHFVWK